MLPLGDHNVVADYLLVEKTVQSHGGLTGRSKPRGVDAVIFRAMGGCKDCLKPRGLTGCLESWGVNALIFRATGG